VSWSNTSCITQNRQHCQLCMGLATLGAEPCTTLGPTALISPRPAVVCASAWLHA
jgi:hypothetical protein